MFAVIDGRVSWDDERGAWDRLEGARGIYILYRGTIPIYIGKAVTGANPIARRIKKHTTDWYSHAWDNVSWYDFADSGGGFIGAVEALLIANIPGTLNGALPSSHLGKRCFIGSDKNHANNTLWQK